MDKSKKKDAVKKVIAAMTVGKDVSSLFPGVWASGCKRFGGCSGAGFAGLQLDEQGDVEGSGRASRMATAALALVGAALSIPFALPRVGAASGWKALRYLPRLPARLYWRSFCLQKRCRCWPALAFWMPWFTLAHPPCPADVINQMQTDDMELKKLVYLYLINYAKTQPDLAIMAVNTFVKARSRQPGRG